MHFINHLVLDDFAMPNFQTFNDMLRHTMIEIIEVKVGSPLHANHKLYS